MKARSRPARASRRTTAPMCSVRLARPELCPQVKVEALKSKGKVTRVSYTVEAVRVGGGPCGFGEVWV